VIKNIKYYSVLLVLLALSVGSCKKTRDKAPEELVEGNYFSINQFMLDEWNTFAGEPFMITKTVREGGKTDSVLLNSDIMPWGDVVKIFSETDISDRKYLGKYKFTQFDDNADQTHNFFYEALDEELFTRKLLITINQFTAKIKGIYIETEQKTVFEDCVRKLYYAPLKTIQIQTNNKPLLGSKKYTVEQYDFMR